MSTTMPPMMLLSTWKNTFGSNYKVKIEMQNVGTYLRNCRENIFTIMLWKVTAMSVPPEKKDMKRMNAVITEKRQLQLYQIIQLHHK
jgi:hypothetical protein